MSELHQPVLIDEVKQHLMIKPDGIYIDGTFGRGGHSRMILEQLNQQGRLIGIDKDPDAIRYAQENLSQTNFSIQHGSFADIDRIAEQENVIGQVDGILLDLGISSPQIDVAERGFSFMHDGPLDMRMNSDVGMSAAQWLATVKEHDLIKVLRDYGEERFARRIAKAIIERRTETPLTSTKQLADLIAAVIPKREPGKNPATRSFQAIRLFINNELDDLRHGLDKCLHVLREGGRLLVISFHSLEDRIVKRFIRHHATGGVLPKGLPVTETQKNISLRRVGKAIKASAEEINNNIRARSAVLRIAEKII